jgi:hypothetical protein
MAAQVPFVDPGDCLMSRARKQSACLYVRGCTINLPVWLVLEDEEAMGRGVGGEKVDVRRSARQMRLRAIFSVIESC